MVLSDRTIKEELTRGGIVIDPFVEDDLQPASVDLHLDSRLRVFRNYSEPYVDLGKDLPELTEIEEIGPERPFILHPGRVRAGQHY